MTFTSIIHPDEIVILSRQVTASITWWDAIHPLISYSTTRSNIRDILPNGALSERCVPGVQCHCAGQQCDIIASNSTEAAWTQHWHRGNNWFVRQLTSNSTAFSIQQEILKQRDVSACSAILKWEWALQTLTVIVTSLFVKCTWSHFSLSITNSSNSAR